MTKKRQIPHTFVLVFSIIVLAAAASWFVDGGEYSRTIKVMPDGTTRNVIDPGSFQNVENNPQTWQIFSALFEGFVSKSDIIVFILLIGGAFWIMNESKAIDVSIIAFLGVARRLERFKFIKWIGIDNIIIALFMIIFSIFGSVFGMSEETIAFIIIFVPLSISMGYDSIVGICMCFFAAGLGFAGATLNPFTIGIAQGLSDLPLFSGLEYRIFVWFVLTVTGIAYVLWYARKIKRDPKKSVMYELDDVWRKMVLQRETKTEYKTPVSAWVVYLVLFAIMVVYSFLYPVSTINFGQAKMIIPIIPVIAGLFLISGFVALRKSVHFFILDIFIFTILFLLVGVMGYHWYVMEIATLFFVMGLASGAAMGYSPNKITELFIAGVKDILSAALVVGLAGGIIVVLQNGKVIDSMLHGIAGSMSDVGKFGSRQYHVRDPDPDQPGNDIRISQSCIDNAYHGTVLRPDWRFTAGNCNGLPAGRRYYEHDHSHLCCAGRSAGCCEDTLRKMVQVGMASDTVFNDPWPSSANTDSNNGS